MIHMEGMGVIGSMTALELARQNIPFTWHDSHEVFSAWRASTGSVVPSSKPEQQRNYLAWMSLHSSSLEGLGIVERGSYWFMSHAIPHGAPGQIAADIGCLRMASEPTFHVNVQELVIHVRNRFREQQLDSCPSETIKIVAHGFHHFALSHYLWGWSAMADVKLADELIKHSKHRPMLYFNPHRYAYSYAYPVPGSLKYYIGTAMIRQKREQPKHYATEDKVQKWADNVTKWTQGKIKLWDSQPAVEGWRPVPYENTAHVSLDKANKTVYANAYSTYGVTYAPLAAKELVTAARQLLEGSL